MRRLVPLTAGLSLVGMSVTAPALQAQARSVEGFAATARPLFLGHTLGEPRPHAASQWASGSGVLDGSPLPAMKATAPELRRPSRSQTRRPDPWKPSVLSAVVPGAGQVRLGQKRGWAYGALELVGWIFYADRRSQGNDFRTQYRDFAWNEARTQTTSRVDADFGYYETLTKWERSGAFDSDDSASGLQPETDATTFNGSIWALASGIFSTGGGPVSPTDPQYAQALGYYTDRAYGPEFLWDWTGTGEARNEYAGLIRASDDGFRQATNVLGAIIANHVFASVDAFVSGRGLATPEATRIQARPSGAGTRWSVAMSWSVQR